MKSVGVVLAAGSSRRAGCAKALVKVGRTSMLAVSIATLRAGGCTEVLVVAGGPYLEPVRRVARRNAARVLINEKPGRGMFSSLQLGLSSLDAAGAVVVSLVDHPHVRADTVKRLLNAVRGGAAAAIPTFEGTPGHPVAYGSRLVRALVKAPPDATARDVLGHARGVRRLAITDASVLEDLDTAAALRKLTPRRATARRR